MEERYRQALEYIRDYLGGSCDQHGKCEHIGCQDSLKAWKAANRALQIPKEDTWNQNGAGNQNQKMIETLNTN